MSPLPDIVAEASRIAAAAAADCLALRITGGVGVALRCPSAGREPLKRPYADVDLVGKSRERRGIVELLAGLGYEPDREFNALHGSERLDQPFTGNDSGINLRYLSGLAAADWGLWKTTTMVAERVAGYAAALDGLGRAPEVELQVRRFVDELVEAPKTRAWKLRAKIGERKRWYELPEEARF